MPAIYQNLIFTNHAYSRLKQRSIGQDAIAQTINYPDEKKNLKDEQIKFIKTINNRKIHVVAVFKRKEDKWLIVSVWVRGEEDQLPLTWQLITLPFRLIYYLLANIAKIILSHNKKSRRLE